MRNHYRKRAPEEKVEIESRFDEKPVVPFEVDVLLREDFARIYQTRQRSPERELMAAVLEEAVEDYQRYFRARDTKGRKRFAEAQAWIVNRDTEWIFSFINCCEALGISPGYLREGLVHWKRAKLTSVVSGVPRSKAPKRLFRRAA